MTRPFSTILLDAEYEGVRFPVADAKVMRGHALAKHVALLRPGADLQWLGREALGGTLSVPLYSDRDQDARYGKALWPDLWSELVTKIRDNPLGRLVHPSEGPLRVGMEAFNDEFRAAAGNGVTLELTWVEDNATAIARMTLAGGTVPTDSTEAASAQAAACDAALDGLGSKPDPPLADVFDTGIGSLLSGVLTYSMIASTIGSMLGAVEGALALPALLVWTPSGAYAVHSAVAALEALRGTTYALRDRFLPNESQARTYMTPRVMAAWEVAVAVYGDASQSSVIRAANALTDPLAIPEGTTLTILAV